jgi:hypothetical protein
LAPFRLYLDEDSQAVALAEALRRAGLDVLRSQEAGMDRTDDPGQLAFATSQRRVIYTANARHFYALHVDYQRAGRSHAGIIVRTHQRYSVGEQARRVLLIYGAFTLDEMVDRAEFISQWD